MFHRHNLEYSDRQLRDIFADDRRHRPFGGIPILLTGNWAQCGVVVPGGTAAAQRAASIRMSPVFNQNFRTFYLRDNMRVGPGEAAFANWLLEIGYGRNMVDGEYVIIPQHNRAQSTAELIEFCFPSDLIKQPLENIEVLRNNCILAPLRKTVAEINDCIRERIPEEYSRTEIIHGFDHRVRDPQTDNQNAVNIAEGDIEYLHHQTPSNFPPYELRLKKGMICIMIANYDPRSGLNNGTRVLILGIYRNLLKVRILSGNSQNIGQELFVGRKKFEKNQNEPGIPFKRTQFPLQPGFALTINKAQGQSLSRVGVDLRSQVIGHGHLYTALSRVTSEAGLLIFSALGDRMLNIVDRELIRGADILLSQPATQNP